MNCKPGDLAVVIGPGITPGIVGRFVTVIRPAVMGERFPSDIGTIRWTGDVPAWVVESANPLPWLASKSNRLHHMNRRAIGDAYLRPIRDQPGEDETLTWAGKPEGVAS